MQRKVVCESKIETKVAGRGPTPDTGVLAPDTTKTEVVLVFYDVGDDGNHRNAYPMTLTKEEAKDFKVGQIYNLNVG